MDSLSPEVVLQILDFLKDDTRTLHNLSLTSSAYTTLSQGLLFSDLTLRAPIIKGTTSVVSQGRDLLELLTTSPHIKSYIHGLRIIDDAASPSDPWLRDPHLTEGLKLLVDGSYIKRFTLDQSRRVNGFFPLAMLLSFSVRDSILAICRSPHLQSLSLHGKAPIELVNACGPSVRSLVLHDLHPGLVDYPSGRTIPIRLTSLEIGHRDGYLSPMIRHLLEQDHLVDLTSLQTLSISTYIEGSRCVSHLLAACSTSLRELIVTCRGSYGFGLQSSDTLDLSSLLNLKSIDLTFETCDSSDSESVEWVVSTLATLPQANTIQAVCVQVKVLEEHKESFPDSPWHSVSQLVANQQGIARFPFEVCFTRSPSEDDALQSGSLPSIWSHCLNTSPSAHSQSSR
ncbi:hypothetical protein BKA70DRAFT_1287863 [Coprinopsis sp. MPI-PUGE-AT-0042]|nr:hypothetical protein BKA70DRAFT_1287863 [Coprinopsis sp. MPI-PUGE-AT-0042]